MDMAVNVHEEPAAIAPIGGSACAACALALAFAGVGKNPEQ